MKKQTSKTKMGNELEIIKGSVRIRLNKFLYSKRAVIIASEAFSESCFVTLESLNGVFVVTLKPKEELDLKEVGYEFFNYVLGIMQND